MYFPTSTIDACFLCAAPKASNMKVSNGFERHWANSVLDSFSPS